MSDEPEAPKLLVNGAKVVALVLAFVGVRVFFGRSAQDPAAFLMIEFAVTVAGAVACIVLWFAGLWAVERFQGGVGRRRLAQGRCEGCGHPLRGRLDKCMDCGMPVWQPRDPLTGKLMEHGRR
jgi:hypothetical protein